MIETWSGEDDGSVAHEVHVGWRSGQRHQRRVSVVDAAPNAVRVVHAEYKLARRSIRQVRHRSYVKDGVRARLRHRVKVNAVTWVEAHLLNKVVQILLFIKV